MRSLVLLPLLIVVGGTFAQAQPAELAEPHEAKVPPPLADRREGQVFTNGIGMKLVWCPPGSFTIGSPDEEELRHEDELAHRVKLTHGFYIGAYEVTRGQFQQFVDETSYSTIPERDEAGGNGYDAAARRFHARLPAYSWRNTGWTMTDMHPVVNITWNDAVAFCAWLSKKEKQNYRLPYEAEWEYACRVDTTTAFHPGEDLGDLEGYANVRDQSASRIPGANYRTGFFFFDDGHKFAAPVGSFKPNPWGLYDMHGNVWEWCQDSYRIDFEKLPETNPFNNDPEVRKVFRGGSWSSELGSCRSAMRGENPASSRGGDLGFRVALSPADED